MKKLTGGVLGGGAILLCVRALSLSLFFNARLFFLFLFLVRAVFSFFFSFFSARCFLVVFWWVFLVRAFF